MTRCTASWQVLSYAAFALLATSCGCVHGDAAPNTAAASAAAASGAALTAPSSARREPREPNLVGARIGVKWQQQMLAKLQADQAGRSEAWALFSEGGWANAGQIMVYGTKEQGLLSAEIVEPEAESELKQHELTAAAFAPVAQVVASADQLDDLNMVAFDALTFEYVHAVKDPATGKVSVPKRVLIRNGGRKDVQQYDRLIAAFQSLRAKPKAAVR